LWALEWKEDARRIDPEWVYGSREEAAEVNATECHGRATVVALYRSPTLTDAERAAIEYVLDGLLPDGDREGDMATGALRGLLARTK
jgi:hypothetical protein